MVEITDADGFIVCEVVRVWKVLGPGADGDQNMAVTSDRTSERGSSTGYSPSNFNRFYALKP